MEPIERVISQLPDARSARGGWEARCPAHDDGRASLSIGTGDDGRVLLHCHAGCPTEAVCEALGLTLRDLMPEGDKRPSAAKPKAKAALGQIVAQYDYHDEGGNLVTQALRYDPKDFRQRRPDGKGGWNWSVKGARVVPYRLPELLANPDSPVYIVEGEKDVDNLAALGVLATCNAGGAEKWTDEHSQFLRGRDVIILPDNDESGRKHAQQVAQLLQGIATSVRVVELPGLPAKGDVSDWIAAGGTAEQLEKLAQKATRQTNPEIEWAELTPYDAEELPEFPVDALPDRLRDWVLALSRSTQVPPDMPAMLALAVIGSIIARRVVIVPRPGWTEPTNLFVCVLLPPANRKSAVFAEAKRPIEEIEREEVAESAPVIARAATERRQMEIKLRKLEKLAGEKDDLKAMADAAALAERLETEPVLHRPAYVVDDVTPERLEVILAEQNGRILSASPESAPFDILAGRYSKDKSPNLNVFLKGHAGDAIRTDRLGRIPVYVDDPAISCAYAVQPAVIRGLSHDAFRGRGFLGRFLWVWPRSWVGNRSVGAEPMPDDIRQAYRDLAWELHESLRNIGNDFLPIIFSLEAQASAEMLDWEREVESMLAEGGELEEIDDWGGKLVGATYRIAAIIHACGSLDPAVTVGDVRAAIAIGRYLIPHAQRVLGGLAGESRGESDGRYLLKWILRHDQREFTKSEAQHHGKRRWPKANDIDDALAELGDRGYIRLVGSDDRRPGRPSSPRFEVNPLAIETKRSRKRSQYSQNSPGSVQTRNCGNIGSAFQDAKAKNRTRIEL